MSFSFIGRCCHGQKSRQDLMFWFPIYVPLVNRMSTEVKGSETSSFFILEIKMSWSWVIVSCTTLIPIPNFVNSRWWRILKSFFHKVEHILTTTAFGNIFSFLWRSIWHLVLASFVKTSYGFAFQGNIKFLDLYEIILSHWLLVLEASLRKDSSFFFRILYILRNGWEMLLA